MDRLATERTPGEGGGTVTKQGEQDTDIIACSLTSSLLTSSAPLAPHEAAPSWTPRCLNRQQCLYLVEGGQVSNEKAALVARLNPEIKTEKLLKQRGGGARGRFQGREP